MVLAVLAVLAVPVLVGPGPVVPAVPVLAVPAGRVVTTTAIA